MKRFIYQTLTAWKQDANRKPIVLRGARQVGKTHVVRQLGNTFSNFVEINFEREPKFRALFEKDLDPKRLIRDISLLLEKRIIEDKTLLFFDEVQEAPKAILALRYFYEEMPKLHIIAAGSLLDFALDSISVPVGRVNFLSMYPMSFMEFLQACQLELMLESILNIGSDLPLTELAHQKILETLAIYIVVGGMPEAVKKWAETRDIEKCIHVHRSLIETYKQDFHKYAKKFQIKYINILFESVPSMLGKKFKYTNVPGEYRKRELLPCLDLLEKANIIHRVFHSAGQGVPLGAQSNLEKFKMIFLDVALAQTLLGLDAKEWMISPVRSLINKGEITESFVGQEILAYANPYEHTKLYYWHREKRGSSAEIDYLIQDRNIVFPIEVKSGKGAQLKSLKMFLEGHPQSSCGIRFSTRQFSISKGLYSYPLYAVVNLFKKK